MEYYAGIDVSLESASICVVDDKGDIVREGKVASEPARWPDPPTRLSYPDWVVARLATDLGADRALGALEQMNVAAEVDERADGYMQDRASQWVAAYVGARPGERGSPPSARLCSPP